MCLLSRGAVRCVKSKERGFRLSQSPSPAPAHLTYLPASERELAAAAAGPRWSLVGPAVRQFTAVAASGRR